MSDDRAQKLEAVAQEIRVCTACRLHEQANNAVPGYGDVNAEILFIGEGPGANEDKQGLPFVGRSGQYLDYLLKIIGMDRAQVFITNVVKHRAPDNRDPRADEMLACDHFLQRQFQIIDPLMVATLGRFSMGKFFDRGKITQIHGQPRYADGRAYYPLFHPAAALRNPGLRHDMEDDIRRIPEVLAEVKRRRESGWFEAQNGGIENSAQPEDKESPDEDDPKQLSLL